jgi:D-arabinose 1-dehydrogenase-like Zn-dependent alcohol dehydrogenase
MGALLGSCRHCDSCSEGKEPLDFRGEHGITPEVEVIPASYVNEATVRLTASLKRTGGPTVRHGKHRHIRVYPAYVGRQQRQ